MTTGTTRPGTAAGTSNSAVQSFQEIPRKPDAGSRAGVGRGQLVHVTVLLGLVNMFNALDRSALSILIEPIKADLGLSDTQLGILTGFAFSLTYALFGIPLARLADTRSRVKLLSACLAVWSFATAVAGLAHNFVQLALTRIVVGIGEAGGSPASVSILGDYYTPEERSRGMSWFQLGGAAGGSLGLGLVGVVAEHYGWRVAFFTMGLPGVLLAVVLLTTLGEPPRGRFQSSSERFDTDIAWYQAVGQVLGRRTMRHVLIAYGIAAFGGAGVGAWFGAFFVRSHGMSLSEVGALLGVVAGLGTFAGAMLGVAFGPKAVRRDRRWELWWPGGGYLAVVPTYMLSLYLDDIFVVCAMLAFTVVVSSSCVGLVLTSIQSVLPAHLRGMGTAAIMFATSLVGVGGGPLLIGLLSDALAPALGGESLRYAMILGVSFIGWGAIHFFIASKHFRDELVS
ncbi:MAG: MFS transporter [Gammaproteobacteria bacterium]|nr:MFS transporter [Gammaproteobacteria bacterium]